jgi:hypothetical protein
MFGIRPAMDEEMIPGQEDFGDWESVIRNGPWFVLAIMIGWFLSARNMNAGNFFVKAIASPHPAYCRNRPYKFRPSPALLRKWEG